MTLFVAETFELGSELLQSLAQIFNALFEPLDIPAILLSLPGNQKELADILNYSAQHGSEWRQSVSSCDRSGPRSFAEQGVFSRFLVESTLFQRDIR
jgi:hypothetical protein